MNNEEDVKVKENDPKNGVVLPTIKNRNQFFDLDDFNSDEKDQEKNGANGNNDENLEQMTPGAK
ncbi:MAG: hypothetical protein AAGH46_08885 [Bacteroidota bacterium]